MGSQGLGPRIGEESMPVLNALIGPSPWNSWKQLSCDAQGSVFLITASKPA